MSQSSLYDVLGLTPNASPDEVRAAYRRTVRRLHPDVGGSDRAFRQVRTAYRVLGDPAHRANYDARLRLGPSGGSTATGPPSSASRPSGPASQAGPGQPVSPEPAPRQASPPNSETEARVRRRYLAMMAVCVVLFVLAGGVVRIFSVPAAVAMMVVVMAIPPLAALMANRSRP